MLLIKDVLRWVLNRN